MKNVISVLLGLIVVAALAFVAYPVRAAGQINAGVTIRQNSTEARLTIGTVDGSNLKKLTLTNLKNGIILADDAGRLIAVRGSATLVWQDNHMQVFQFSEYHADNPGTRVVRVTAATLMLFEGDDWDHPYESAICTAPQATVEECIS